MFEVDYDETASATVRRKRTGRAAAAAVSLVALATLATVFCGCGSSGGNGGSTERSAVSSPPASTAPASTVPPAPFEQQMFTERRTINYAGSEPANNSVTGAPVEKVTISFSKPLGAGSFIEVTKDGLKVNAGQVVVAPDNLSMHVPVAAGVTGNYAVKYAAYFSSGYYEEGAFGFSVRIP